MLLVTVYWLGVLGFSSYWIPPVETARILGVFPIASYSHYALGSRLMKELAMKGHDVTIITPYREKNPPKNYREIFLDDAVEKMEDRKREFFKRLEVGPISMMLMMNYMGAQFTESILAHTALQNLLNNSDEKFDVVILEQFKNDAHKGIVHHFKAPLIAFSTMGSGPWVNHLVANPAPSSYIPNPILAYSPRMSFWQRLINGVLAIFGDLNNYFLVYPTMNKILQKYFPGAPSVEELNNNVSLVLLNSHVSVNQPVPHVPNMIEIGGFHVYPPKKLPEDLQKYLDEAKEGVIYFSMGSNLQSSYLPEEKKRSILNAFSKVNMKVLWKFEDDTLTDIPKNVKLSKWVPQQDLLAHPNVKLFITHGGLLSTIETIYHGVPILGIPMFGDQKMNMANAVLQGYGRLLDFKDLTEETLLNEINEILQNPKYSENVKTRSTIMKDQPIRPLDNAVFWVEYVIRHRGAPHFRSAALDLTWYQYHMIDVILFVFAVLTLVFALFYYVLKRLFQWKFAVKQKVDRKKKRN